MPNVIIRQLPAGMHQKIKERATRHHRSINKEIIALLEEALSLNDSLPTAPPTPFIGRFQINDDWLRKAREEDRP